MVLCTGHSSSETNIPVVVELNNYSNNNKVTQKVTEDKFYRNMKKLSDIVQTGNG